jgi:TldD protein
MKQPIAFALIFTILLCGGAPVKAETDPVMQALVDEMDRTTKSLHLDPHPVPYYVSYSVRDIEQYECFSCLGSKAEMAHYSDRQLRPIARIGDAKLDSSFPSTTRADFYSQMALDDDYTAIRRLAWLTTDKIYKNSIAHLEWKKAFLAENNVSDRMPDLTKVTPVVSSTSSGPLQVDSQKWCTTVEKLSAIFKDFPTLQKSRVSFIARKLTRWYVNNEGTRLKDSKTLFAITFWATAQAPDGMPLMDHDGVAATEEQLMPDYATLKQKVEELAKRVSDLRLAPMAEEYVGPVLFEGQGAAEFFSQIMAPNFDLAEEYLGNYEKWRNPLTKGIGRRILPKSMSVVDDPQAKEFHGSPLVGGYKFDDDGVAGEQIQLVENGMLKGFCQSRLPTRHSQTSNGHSYGGIGVHSILFVSASKPTSPEELKHQEEELAKDAGLDYILVIPRLCVCHSYQFEEVPFGKPFGNGRRAYDTPAYSGQPTDPIVAYKLFLSDGHRELVRGLEFRDVSLSAFRDIQAVGDDAAAYLVEPGDHVSRHLITPSFLARELVLTPIKPEHSTPPQVTSPLADVKP